MLVQKGLVQLFCLSTLYVCLHVSWQDDVEHKVWGGGRENKSVMSPPLMFVTTKIYRNKLRSNLYHISSSASTIAMHSIGVGVFPCT